VAYAARIGRFVAGLVLIKIFARRQAGLIAIEKLACTGNKFGIVKRVARRFRAIFAQLFFLVGVESFEIQ